MFSKIPRKLLYVFYQLSQKDRKHTTAVQERQKSLLDSCCRKDIFPQTAVQEREKTFLDSCLGMISNITQTAVQERQKTYRHSCLGMLEIILRQLYRKERKHTQTAVQERQKTSTDSCLVQIENITNSWSMKDIKQTTAVQKCFKIIPRQLSSKDRKHTRQQSKKDRNHYNSCLGMIEIFLRQLSRKDIKLYQTAV